MGKRKQSTPNFADQTKRQQLQWSMTDQFASSASQSFIYDGPLRDENSHQSNSLLNSEISEVEIEVSSSSATCSPVHAIRIDAFYQNLASCHFSSLTLFRPNDLKGKDKGNLLEFGTFTITLTPHSQLQALPDSLPEFGECFLYLGVKDNPSMLYFEAQDNRENITHKKRHLPRQTKFGVFWYVSLSVPVSLLTDLKNNSFVLQFSEFNSHQKSLTVTVFAKEGVVLQISHPSESIRIRPAQVAIQKLMAQFYQIYLPYDFEGRTRTTGHDFFALYESVMSLQKERLSQDKTWQSQVDSIDHKCLKPLLRPYQKQSVTWMLRQEGCHRLQEAGDDLHPLYCEVTLRDGTTLYYNRHGGSFLRNRPKSILALPGGILADEMGLGKTVEVLCCMLLHPRSDVKLPEELPVIDDVDMDSPECSHAASETGKSTEDSSSQQTQSLESQKINSDLIKNQCLVTLPMGEVNQSQVGSAVPLETYQINDRSKDVVVQNAVFLSNQEIADLMNSSDCPTSAVCERSKGKYQVAASDRSNDKYQVAASIQDGVIKVNEFNEMSIIVETNQNQHILASQETVISNHLSSNSDIVNSHSSNSHLSFATDSNMQHSSVVPTQDGSIKKKRKKRLKDYVEYVPVTTQKSSYFSSKPAAQKQYFECNCGQLDDEEETRRKGFTTVKCTMCGMSQHAECMNYDLRDPYRGEYLCPHCHSISSAIKSGATLIISPYSICHQWVEEIGKHIKERHIKVFIYTGVSKLGYIQPQTLAQQDIVITTYDVLRKEVDYVNLPHTNCESGRRFRHPKRFLATPSPMVAVEWWRICLDEAQMVECVTTKTAEMALKLKAVNRWCVTGTPLMRSVEDIYGLLLFLGVDPLMVQQWFRLLVWEPFCHGYSAPMVEALAQVLWRTAKKDVIHQIDLPDQTEEINWLTFSPVEEHFYRRQYEMYLRNALANKRRLDNGPDPNTKLHALDRKTMNELLSPLYKLRQACCHPQIVRGEFLPLNKAMMTMEELLEHMTKKVKTECEEAHRQIVASLNGMAGLAILRGQISEAIDKYRDVLRSVEEHKKQFRTDELQQLHAMHNLAQLLDTKPEGVAPTLRDEFLREQCEDLKKKYMSRTKTNVTTSKEALEATQLVLMDLTRKLAALDGDWWADVIDMTVQRGIDNDLIFKVKDDLGRTTTTEGTIAEIFSNANGLMYVVDTHLQTLTKARQNLTNQLEALAQNTSPALVQTAAMCCLRPVEDIQKVCPFCKVDELFNEYESKLFLFVERGVTVTGDDSTLAYQINTRRQGTWADSEVERAIKSILAFYRLHFDTDQEILEAAAQQLKYLETLKKEFKNLRTLWLSHREMVSAIDELDMATERLRLRQECEPPSASKILNVIEARDMTHQELKCASDEIVGRAELKKKLGQLLYLTNLTKKNQDGQECNPDTCPICQNGLGMEWSVLLCGHCYCLTCIQVLIDRNLIGSHLLNRSLKCPVCRHMTSLREISYVTTIKTEQLDVKGSQSTKVQAVIQCLIKIHKTEPSAKSLVFSVWTSVLDILAAALLENGISFKTLHDPNHFQKNLTAFKSDESIQVLLLALHTGAHGLNLVEANHMLLVEPQLNLEEEAQAISRIYRIGQTRQTKIHRFLVRGTIEEKIYHLVKTLRDTKSGLTQQGELPELTVGHITSLLQQPAPDPDDEELEEVTQATIPSSSGQLGTSLAERETGAGSSVEAIPGGLGDVISSSGGEGSSGGHEVSQLHQSTGIAAGVFVVSDPEVPHNEGMVSTDRSTSSSALLVSASTEFDSLNSTTLIFSGHVAGTGHVPASSIERQACLPVSRSQSPEIMIGAQPADEDNLVLPRKL